MNRLVEYLSYDVENKINQQLCIKSLNIFLDHLILLYFDLNENDFLCELHSGIQG